MSEDAAANARIRRAGTDDAAALHEVAAATFALACPPGTSETHIAAFIAENLSVERMTDYLADPGRDLFLAENPSGRAIGYTMIVHGQEPDAEVAAALTVHPSSELSKCYLLPESHGTGASAALVEATVDAARRRGAAAVWLGVNQQNARANRFYEKRGFRLVGTKHFTVGDEIHDDFVRERTL